MTATIDSTPQRILVVLLAFVVTASVLAGAPAHGNEPAPPSLVGTNTFSVTRTSSIDVRLPQRTTFSIEKRTDQNSTVQIDGGGGRATGIVLAQRNAPEETQAQYAAVRWSADAFCAECPEFWGDRLTTFAVVPGQTINGVELSMPAGDYRLTVIADDRPTTVTLTLPGLDGARTWTPTIPGELVVKRLTRRTPDTTSNFAVFGDAERLASPGFLLDSLRVSFTLREAHVWSFCTYSFAPTNPLAYFPGCPEGDTHLVWPESRTDLDNPLSPPGIEWSGFSLRDAGTWGTGGSMTAGSLVDTMGWVGLWVATGA